MPNRPLAMAMVTVVALTAGARPGWADTNATVTVRVRDEAHLPARTVQNALMIVSGVYRRAGVTVQWLPTAVGEAADSTLTIAVVPAASAAAFQGGKDSMGVARNAEGIRGNLAYVFFDRVRDFGERGHVDTFVVLGFAIAHELGHLLLPVNSHSADGIMRARWDPKIISRAGGFLSFAPDQARLLRLRVAGRYQE
jgi:hypothetical protein